MAQWLDPSAPVLARELQKAGYATGHFGKWHMGGQRDVAEAPEISEYGFDRSLTNFEGMGAKLLPLTMTPDSDKPGRIWEKAVILGEPVTWMQRSEITGGFVDAALEFIDEAEAEGKPFFVNVWPDDVHGPFFPPLARWGPDKRGLYYAVLDTMDEQLAPLFDRIRNDENLRDNTLIVVCSDNGHEPGAGMSDPLRGSKTWIYEGGIRSPLIVWGPGLISEKSAGTVNDTSIFSAVDLNRSFYALADSELPEGAQLDGENVIDTLLGNSKSGRKGPIFFRRPPDRPGNDPKWGMGDNPDLAVRDGKWKFLINYDGSDPQLFDLEADISESNNLAEKHPEVVQRLEQSVFEWNATLPRDAGDPDYKAQAVAGENDWHPLFNGRNLDGWHTQQEQGQHGTGGHWGVTDGGLLFGEQDPPGSGNGGLLLTDEKFASFEMALSLKPDWGPCSGVFVRTDERGGGWQIYVDHHDNGNVGHVRLETKPYSVPFRPFGFSRIDPDQPKLEMAVDKRAVDWPEGVYEETCSEDEWLKAWKPKRWNRLRICCSGGELPVIETWVNDLKVCRFDASKTTHPAFDRDKAKEAVEPSGSIGLQVHGGKNWQEGDRVFWKDVQVRQLP